MYGTIVTGSIPSVVIPTFSLTNPTMIVKTTYILEMTKDEDGRIVVTCPNMQGVITDGKDEDEALKNGIEALNAILHVRKLSKEYDIVITHKLSA
jgi:predicted RNase H-like HicB family nuclease